ncbi:MAG: response regulator [Gemmatimonadales bacterium]
MTGRILVVDDDHDMVRTLSDILTMKGWTVTGAHSGEEAVDLACSDGFSAILMDIRMPGMDGVAAFKAIKQCTAGMRVVLMTAHTAPESLAEARREGAHAVLTKPLDLSRLIALLE